MPKKPSKKGPIFAALSIDKKLHKYAQRYARAHEIPGGFSGLVTRLLINVTQTNATQVKNTGRRFDPKKCLPLPTPGSNSQPASAAAGQ